MSTSVLRNRLLGGMGSLVCLLSAMLGATMAADVPVTDGLLLWLDATDPATLFQDIDMTTPAGDGDPVALWLDKSGNGFHATQADDFLRPTWESDVMNGQAAVRFDGLDGDGMAINEDLFLVRPYTVFIVNEYWGDVRGRTLQGLDSNWLHGLWSGRISSYAGGFIGPNATAEVDTPYVEDTTGSFDGSSMFANGLDMTTNPTPLGEPGRLGFGSVGQFPAEVSDADVSEVVIYDRVLSDDELNAVRQHLYTKYDVTQLEPPPPPKVFFGDVRTFEGGDAGEGLDMDGTFLYAVNVGGPGDVTIGDADFTDGSEGGMANGESPGVSITDANEILDWHLPDYGDTPDDDSLEFVMQSIRWNVPPGLEIDLEVEAGRTYKLQLLFAESCCDRGFDIFIEDEQAVNDFNVQREQGGINNPTEGVVFEHTLVAGDDELNIVLGGMAPQFPDNNPILNALTLEVDPGDLLPGDFNGDGMIDAADIDLLSAEIRGGNPAIRFDLNGDGGVDAKDRVVWVEQLAGTYFGDANLDGVFDTQDFLSVFQIGEYEDAVTSNSTWSEGDWDGSGDFDSTDFVLAFQGGGFEKGPRAAVAAVPEPGSALSLIIGSFVWLLGRSRRRTR